MKCRDCENRENIIDEALCDVVGWKCGLTNTIISSEVEDGLEAYEDNCPIVVKAKVFVTNITKDTNKDMGYGVWLHHVICDCTIENGKTEKQAYRIFSHKEYDDVINKGYYEIEDNSVQQKFER